MPLPFMTKDLRTKIMEHVGKDPSNFTIITESFDKYNHPNLHLALSEFVSQPGRGVTILGIQTGAMSFTGTSLAELISPKSMVSMIGFGGAKEGPVQYMNVNTDKEKIACVQQGLYLISGEPKLTAFLHPQQGFGGDSNVLLDVMAESPDVVTDFMNTIRTSINTNNIYRGKLLSIDRSESELGSAGRTGLKFHTLPELTRDKIILPEGLLHRIERQTVEAGQYNESLLKAKRKLKRGLLLHGRPGTGKTLTAMYLASAMKERTVMIVTGRGLGLIEASCNLARWLQPSMVVIEDVDLIAQERSTQSDCSMPILFELLNQMDGLADDADVLFVLTTNRPEILEPALAARPGRIDQAYEIPLPDAECRRKLFELYGDGLNLEVSDMEVFVKRTAGASGAFISELMRKAALFAAPEGDPIVVRDKHLDEAMHELLLIGGAMTKSLLGFREIGFAPAEDPSLR
jgi:hypothetical protein